MEVIKIRTRYMNLSDYGVFQGDDKKLKIYCRNLKTAEERLFLFQCSINAAPGLEIAVYESLTTGDGYRTLERRGRKIPAKEDDFYAYRRKAMAEFYDWLRLTGRWKY